MTPDGAQRLHEEIDLDFKFFESVITRIQLLKDTNKREVERYEKEKGDICEYNLLPRCSSGHGLLQR